MMDHTWSCDYISKSYLVDVDLHNKPQVYLDPFHVLYICDSGSNNKTLAYQL